MVTFLGIIGCFWWNWRKSRAMLKEQPPRDRDLLAYIPGAVAVSVFLLLFMGAFGHNLFRFSWLWYGGFLIIARHCLTVRAAEAEEQPPAEEAEAEAEEPGALPSGWTWHASH